MNGLLAQIALAAIPILLAITLHEAAHGYAALYFGDDTAKRQGRLTLNPLKHIDLFGTVLLPLVLIVTAGFVFGYAKPVPVDWRALRNPKRDMIWVAAAGPAMNVALAAVSALLLLVAIRLEPEVAEQAGNLLLRSVELNFVLACLNMLPFPPLDGSKVVGGLLPDALARPYLNLGRYGMGIILLLFIGLPIIGQQMHADLDLFVPLVQRPAEFLTHGLLSLVGAA